MSELRGASEPLPASIDPRWESGGRKGHDAVWLASWRVKVGGDLLGGYASLHYPPRPWPEASRLEANARLTNGKVDNVPLDL